MGHEGLHTDRRAHEGNPGGQRGPQDAIAKGMSTEEALATWKTMDQVLVEFRQDDEIKDIKKNR